MIIWLNGPFGVGKMQVALELQRRINGAFLYEPTNVGKLLTKQLPQQLRKKHMEDYPEWREWNQQLLTKICTETDQTVIVPMTITKQQDVDEMIAALRQADINVRHFTLTASPEVIAKRLRQSGNLNNAFTLSRLQNHAAQDDEIQFPEVIDTDELSIVEIANTIAKKCSLRIKPAITNPVLQGFVQLGTGIQHKFH